MTLAQFTELDPLVPHLHGEWRDNTIAELSRRLENAGCVENASTFTTAALAHESVVSAVFDGVAFPLARGPLPKKLSFALGLSKQGIGWKTVKAPAVHVIVLFAVPPSAENGYLSLMVMFGNLIDDNMAFAALRRSVQPEEMFTALKQVRLQQIGLSQHILHD